MMKKYDKETPMIKIRNLTKKFGGLTAVDNISFEVNDSEIFAFLGPNKPNPSDYEVVFAIISSRPETLEIPFFSKVSLLNARRRLETFGYNKVYLQKISVAI